MTLPVVIRRNQKSRRSIRGTICSSGSSASSGLAHSDISFSGDPRIQSLQKSFRGVAKGFQAIRSLVARLSHVHLTRGASACVTANGSDPTSLGASVT